MPIREYEVAQPHWRGGILVESGTVQLDDAAAKYDVANGNIRLKEERTEPADGGAAPEPVQVNRADFRFTDAPVTPQDATQREDTAKGPVASSGNTAADGEPATGAPDKRQRNAR